MAEINWGLIDTQSPAKIANALMPSPEQQGAQALQMMQLQQQAGALKKAKQEADALDSFYTNVASAGGPKTPLEIENAYIATRIPQYVKAGLDLRSARITREAYQKYEKDNPLDLTGASNALPGVVGAAPAAPTSMAGAGAAPVVAGATTPQSNALVGAAAPTSGNALAGGATGNIPAVVAQLRRRLAQLDAFPNEPGAKRDAELITKQIQELTQGRVIGAGSTLRLPGQPDFTAPAAPSEFENLLAKSGLSAPEQTAARQARVGKESGTSYEFMTTLDRLGKTIDPTERTYLKARLTQLSSHAPGSSVTVKLPPVEGEYSKTFAKDAATEDIKLLTAARGAPKLVTTANNIMEMLNKPDILVGPAATIKLSIAKGLNVLGATDNEKISNTEKLISASGQATLDAIKSANLGTGQGFTDKDLRFLQSIAGGNIDLTAESLRAMARLQQRVAELSVKEWTARRANMPESATKGTGLANETYNLPPRVGGPTPEAIAYLKANPNTKAAFDARYGDGEAAHTLRMGK